MLICYIGKKLKKKITEYYTLSFNYTSNNCN